jgi:hypothetical protein
LLLSVGSCWAQDKDRKSRITVCDNLFRTGQLEAALNCYRQSLETDPHNPSANLRVCQVLEATGKVDQMEPFISRLDRSSNEVRSFLEMLSSDYGALEICCEGPVACRHVFRGKAKMQFVPPEELEPGKAKRLSAINNRFKNAGDLWFQKKGPDSSLGKIYFFPIIVGAPMPYMVQIGGQSYTFNFNFLQREAFLMKSGDLDTVTCVIPDSMAEVQVEIDDPDFLAGLSLTSATDSSRLEIDNGRYYISRGQTPALQFEKKGKPIMNKKYLIISSLVLASALILFQR